MTAHRHHAKPRYGEVNGPAAQGAMASCPPFLFREVTSRVFPIRANMARLSTFCDQYLNMDIPEAVVQFRPSLPYVYLMVINYGSMSAESVRAQNFGWVAQREVTFTVPLERWARDPDTGRWRFLGWACVSPFIFVDDALSLSTGREVYGWPKVAAEVDADVPLWASDPRAATRLFSLRTPMFPELYDGAREEPHELIQIDRDSVPRFSEVPPDPDNPWNPLSILANASRNALGLMGDAADMLSRSRVRGYRHGWDPATLSMMSRAAGRNLGGILPQLGASLPTALRGMFRPLLGETPDYDRRDAAPAPGAGIDMITLKQFRDTQDPSQACYQAVVRSRMTIERVNRCGLLGDYNLLRGDPSGGYSIRIHRYAAQPIVDCLGLDVARTEVGTGVPVAILKPTFPFWTDVDLRYGTGDTLCSRAQCAHPDARCTDWQHGSPAADGRTTSKCDGEGAHDADGIAARAPRRLPYNTLQGAATQAVTGPFEFPDVTLQVYPLKASRSALASFVQDYLNTLLESAGASDTGCQHRFEAFGSHVYLLVSTLGAGGGGMWSETNDIGWWADKDVSFCVPVRHYRRAAPPLSAQAGPATAWECAGLGIVAPFVFANSSRAVITDREINGRPSIYATIASPPDPWLSPSGPIAKRHLLTVATDMFPAFFMGQKARQETLLEICEREGALPLQLGDDPVGGEAAPACHGPLHHWLTGRTHTDSLPPASRDTLARIPRIHLKQYRDAEQVDRACYQALVETPRFVREVFDVRPISQALQIRLAMTPAYAIASTLGLKVEAVEHTATGIVQVIEPKRPFWLRVSLREELGRTLCWRTEDGGWTPGTPLP